MVSGHWPLSPCECVLFPLSNKLYLGHSAVCLGFQQRLWWPRSRAELRLAYPSVSCWLCCLYGDCEPQRGMEWEQAIRLLFRTSDLDCASSPRKACSGKFQVQQTRYYGSDICDLEILRHACCSAPSVVSFLGSACLLVWWEWGSIQESHKKNVS